MAAKEAKARIKINKLLEESAWRMLDSKDGKANVLLENNVKITSDVLDKMGEDFQKTNGFVDYLLLDEKGFPLVVLEAKSESKDALFGKEQARKYARSQNCRFAILSNGNSHYFWDLEQGDPQPIAKFPTQKTIQGYFNFKPNPQALADEDIQDNYIAQTQFANFKQNPSWINLSFRKQFIYNNNLKFLRPFQVAAVKSIQNAVKEGKDRFLFEMATGTGKTLTSAAVIKLFLRTRNASRILFLVDRLELEDQAKKAFDSYLKNDYKTVIFKENQDDWHHAEIVVTTVQSLLFKNKFKRIFQPTDFDLVISDEAHRSINGNSRSVFEYFIGYKLGLTATPKEYLKNIKEEELSSKDPRQLEKRNLLDTYKTFGCGHALPTFRYSLLDGVGDGYLVNPVVTDARTNITTQLLSEKGYIIGTKNEEGKDVDETYLHKDFEKKFFSEITNQILCKTFLENALRDPITNEIGKTIFFCVSQKHAAKIAQILNKMATNMFPDKYNSDFALQVTSSVQDAQKFTSNFAYNTLSGSGNFNPLYKTSKTRVCVTVGMMTTGYDCEDILNLCLLRPIFSPSEFIQIKGRGTRKHNFLTNLHDSAAKETIGILEKEKYKIFDFFGNFDYFENTFNYDEVLILPKPGSGGSDRPGLDPEGYENFYPDPLKSITDHFIDESGMKVDRMYYQKFEDTIKADKEILKNLASDNWDAIIEYVEKHILGKPKEYFNLDKLRKSVQADRRITLREFLEKALGLIPRIKSKDEVIDEEFEKFDSRYTPDAKYFEAVKNFFKSYLTDGDIREIIESRNYALLNTNPNGNFFRELTPELRKLIPEYIKDNVSLNQFI